MRSWVAALALAAAACGRTPPEARADDVPAAVADASVARAAGAQEPRRAASDSVEASRASAIVRAAALAAPAVVSVNVIRRERRAPQTMFDWFWAPRGIDREVQGWGSGFAVGDGVIITNEHVTDGATQIVVTTRDGTDYPARLLGEDPLTDIAVLRVDAPDLPVVLLGRSTDLLIGEWVVAIGNPFAYLLGNSEPTVTAGVVSAVGRNIIPSGNDQSIYAGMIQTDAAINPGNSGGPLVNALGEVVGVNSSIFSQSGGSVGIGFAIPIERALRVARELQRSGRIRRAWVGLSVVGSEGMRAWKEAGGLTVTAVVPEGPAARAGLRDGDVLITAAGRPMHTFLDWEAAKLDVGPGDRMAIAYRRGSADRTASVTVEDLPSAVAERVEVLGDMQLITLSAAVRQERRIESDQGAVVYTISDNVARGTGLREGDVILQVNRQRVARAEDVQRLFAELADRNAPVQLAVERGGTLVFTNFRFR